MKQSVRQKTSLQDSVTVAFDKQRSPTQLAGRRTEAKAWIETIDPRRRQIAAWSFVSAAVKAYAAGVGDKLRRHPKLSPFTLALSYALDFRAQNLAEALGHAATTLPVEDACYQLSSLYTLMLPPELRSISGAYYTPPALTQRLLELTTEAGVDWKSARVLDPACGGGAFLVPVALCMRNALGRISAAKLLVHFAAHLRGFEIDPFAAWLTQAWLEIIFAKEIKTAKTAFPTVVTVCDSLEQMPDDLELFDLVIGNPPYGRRTLSRQLRQTYQRSLYGHANLYGLFTDLALRWARPGGIVSFVTPTSFLAGEYFKALRGLLADEAAPLSIDFIASRKGVFEDVLQEAALVTYVKGHRASSIVVHHLDVSEMGEARVAHVGQFRLPVRATDPWLAPREPTQQSIVDGLANLSARLIDWGYKISTGPLVWNRHKSQLTDKRTSDTLPLVWAEAVTSDGKFVFRANKKNHQPFFRMQKGDDWLRVTTPCVLLQRTTAKEQSRRLIATELPASFLAAHGAVVVENHLNMIKPLTPNPKVAPAIVAAVLNSRVVDAAFRCISGSVAVSAFELEALPLPTAEEINSLAPLFRRKNSEAVVERELRKLFANSNYD